ncbi:hypothetical protein VNO77_44311 [Canavalia gladiata]|uniref:Uncharacterized protein n=1 Tax=Canavalia gladiata TaxID=3824 RepID=A0AAN9JVP6_CANGL
MCGLSWFLEFWDLPLNVAFIFLLLSACFIFLLPIININGLLVIVETFKMRIIAVIKGKGNVLEEDQENNFGEIISGSEEER